MGRALTGVGLNELLCLTCLESEMTTTDSELTMKARGVARCLSYNDDEPQAAAKHLLLEMAHRIDTKDIRVHKKRDGYLLINGVGKARFMTWPERIRWMLFGVRPERV